MLLPPLASFCFCCPFCSSFASWLMLSVDFFFLLSGSLCSPAATNCSQEQRYKKRRGGGNSSRQTAVEEVAAMIGGASSTTPSHPLLSLHCNQRSSEHNAREMNMPCSCVGFKVSRRSSETHTKVRTFPFLAWTSEQLNEARNPDPVQYPGQHLGGLRPVLTKAKLCHLVQNELDSFLNALCPPL